MLLAGARNICICLWFIASANPLTSSEALDGVHSAKRVWISTSKFEQFEKSSTYGPDKFFQYLVSSLGDIGNNFRQLCFFLMEYNTSDLFKGNWHQQFQKNITLKGITYCWDNLTDLINKIQYLSPHRENCLRTLFLNWKHSFLKPV